MPLPSVGAEVYLDIDRYENSINQAISLADDLDARLGNMADSAISIDVEANIDASEAEGLVSDLETFDGSTYEATAEALTEDADFIELDETILEFDGLESEGVAIATTEGDQDVEDLQTEMGEVEGEHEGSVEVDANKTNEAETTFGMLDAIKAGLVFTAIINVAGTILDALHSIESLTLTPFLDVDEASAAFAAHTGEAADSVEDMIFRIHQADLGDFNDIEAVLETGRSIGLTGDALEEATTQALNFTKVFDDQNPSDVIAQINRMIDLGLVDTFQEGADVLTVAFQQGGNRAGDLLQTLEMYGPMFSAMGLDAQEAMALLNEGVRNGYRNTSDFARQIATMQDNVIAASADTSSAAAEAFDNIGVDLPAEGEEMGAEFIQNVINGINSLPPGAGRDAAISAIFGRRAGGTEALLNVDIGASFENIEGGEAEQAAAVLDDHLRGTFDDIGLQIETIAHDFLSSEQIDLPGKMAAIKVALQGALEEVAQGATLGDALESGLSQAFGGDFSSLSDSVERLESAIGQFVIEFSLGVASILSAFGNTQGADQVRQFAQGLSSEQLEFDLRIADDGEQLSQAVTDALRRGVGSQDIWQSVNEAAHDALAAGNEEAAQDMVDAAQAAFMNTPLELQFTSLSENIAEEIASTSAIALPRVPQEQQYHLGITAPEPIAPAIVADMAAVIAGTQAAEEAVIISAGAIGEAVQGADEVIHEAIIGGSIVPDLGLVGPAAQRSFAVVPIAAAAMSLAMMANGVIVNAVSFQIVAAFQSIEMGSSALLVAATRVDILKSAIEGLGNVMPTLDAIAQKLASISSGATNALGSIQAVASAGSTINNNTTNINVNQNNNVQNNAQAAQVSQQTANAVRGF